MADTVRSLSALQALLPDNTSRDISPQDLRDFLVSAYRPTLINPGGRLSTESGVGVSSTDRTGQGTIYYPPYIHNGIALYDGTSWTLHTFTERSLAASGTSGQIKDIFLYDNAGTLTLEQSAAWASDTTRTDALTTQDGIIVKSGATTRRWLGTVRYDGSNTVADSAGGGTTQVGGKRFVWNKYNQVPRHLSVIDTTDSWGYTTNTWRVANGATGPLNCIEYVTGDAATVIIAAVQAQCYQQANAARGSTIGVGLDSTTAPATGSLRGAAYNADPDWGVTQCLAARYVGAPGLGYHYLSWLEKGADTTCTFTGDNAGDGSQTGLVALING